MAEVWGSVLRRLKTTAREKAVKSLLHNLKGVEGVCAWAIIFACKVRPCDPLAFIVS
jgi:U3 small nucleolar RNA-associated protein 20